MAKKTDTRSSTDVDFKEIDSELPPDFVNNFRKKFEASGAQDLTFDRALSVARAEHLRQSNLSSSPQNLYQPTLGTKTQCGNGDFEPGIDGNQWQAATGSINPWISANLVDPLTGNLLSPWTEFPANLSAWIGPGTDPYVPALSRTAPNSSGAVRVGHPIANYRTDLLSKTFVVSQPYMSFWYAFVAQATHIIPFAPSFTVVVKNSSGALIPLAVDLGGGQNTVAAATPNAQTNQLLLPTQDPDIWYKEWSCCQIDLSGQVGNVVTVEFITKGCGGGGHWGYAYIDRLCGDCTGSPAGIINYDAQGSTNCGKGKICFDYALPTTKDTATGATATGEIQIELKLYQNGLLASTMDGPKLTSGSKYCFEIDPTQVPGVDTALGGFDFMAVASFTIDALGYTLGQTKIGIAPEGMSLGINNDYLFSCGTCEDVRNELQSLLAARCKEKQNTLTPLDKKSDHDCACCNNESVLDYECIRADIPEYRPCIACVGAIYLKNALQVVTCKSCA